MMILILIEKLWKDGMTMTNRIGADGTISLNSIIKKYFSNELLFEIDKLTMMHNIDNNSKFVVLPQILKGFDVPFKPLGTGTNRYAALIDGYVVKFAIDDDGKIDNKREFIYSRMTQPYTFKVYECMKTGLLAVGEYFEVFSKEDFLNAKNQTKMLQILKDLSKRFLIGDVGLDAKNYANWGYRSDGSIGILDFAYVYDLSFKVFECTCPQRGMLYYNNDYTMLICPACKKKFEFADIRKRISRQQQDDEIGDITQKGYVVKSAESKVPVDERFSLWYEKKKPKIKKKKESNELNKGFTVPDISDMDTVDAFILDEVILGRRK